MIPEEKQEHRVPGGLAMSDLRDLADLRQLFKADKSTIPPQLFNPWGGSAKAYERLGHLDTAFRFIDYAAKLDPPNTDYQQLATDLRTRSGCRNEAMEAQPSSRGA